MDEKILKEILADVRETRAMVNSINKQRRWTNFFNAVKWIIIIGIAYGAYLAATPYIETYQQTVQSINNLNSQMNQMQNMDKRSFTDFLKGQLQKRFGN